MERERQLLLGEGHSTFDQFEVVSQAAGRTACAICAGAEATSIKDQGARNEDAALVIDDGERTLVAVADAHFGGQASHDLLSRLASVAEPIPRNPLALLELLPALADPGESASYDSESTLLVAVLDRAKSSGFGVSAGDSSLALLRPGQPLQGVNRKNRAYVQPCEPSTLDPRRLGEFWFRTQPGDLLVAFTDGVDECHYQSPSTSVRPGHMEEIHTRAGGQPEAFVRELMQLALSGVEGFPGGQDNIAVVATGT